LVVLSELDRTCIDYHVAWLGVGVSLAGTC
jgi:hypothetical protein